MKKLLLLALLLPAVVYAAEELYSFRTIRTIGEINATKPTIVEISGVTSSSGYAVVDDTGKEVPIQERVNRIFIAPTQVTACAGAGECVPAQALSDNSEATTFDFPLLTQGLNRGKITIVYARPLLTNSFFFHATRDSYLPTSFSLVVDGKRVLNSLSGDRAVFPQMMAQKIEVEFEYYQTLRFTEVGAGANFEESNKIRFIYEPGRSYVLYTDARGEGSAPNPNIDLFSKTAQSLTLGDPSDSPRYIEPDTDRDLIPDVRDNCPTVANFDQADNDKNGTGDICDDYEFDGVPTYMDNCPTVANADQVDTDKDGKGDACDGEESRITEKYPWMPWVVMGLVFLTLGFMGYEVVKGKRDTPTPAPSV
jgi:hypothetical protein